MWRLFEAGAALIRVNTVFEWKRHILSCIWVVCLFGLFQMFKIVLVAKTIMFRFNDYLQWYILLRLFLYHCLCFLYRPLLNLKLSYPWSLGFYSVMSSNQVKSTLVPWVSLFLSEDKRDLGNKFKKDRHSYSNHGKLPSSITLRFKRRSW